MSTRPWTVRELPIVVLVLGIPGIAQASSPGLLPVLFVVLPGLVVGQIVLGLLATVPRRSPWSPLARAVAFGLTTFGLYVSVPFIPAWFERSGDRGLGSIYLIAVFLFGWFGSIAVRVPTWVDELADGAGPRNQSDRPDE